MFSYEHSAEPGDVRKYYLYATRNITVDSIEDFGSEESKTLGKPEVIFDNYNYEKINIKWKPVQKATSYRINFAYERAGPVLESVIILQMI